MLRKCIVSLLLLLGVQTMSAQLKVERESRIKRSAVPTAAVDLVNQLSDKTRWRWYREESQGGTTIEAKGKVGGRKCSVEFYEDGRLQDVEVVVEFKTLPDSVQAAICEVLNAKDYYKIKMLKVQDQFVGEVREIAKAIRIEPTAQVQHRYEIEVEAKTKEEGQNRYEYTFDAAGAVLSIEQVVLRNMDNLEY